MMFASLMFLIGINYAISQDCAYEKFTPDHTMCAYTKPGCRLLRNSVSDDEITTIVDVHNQFRNKVATGQQENQPEAANMKQLTWDSELAKIAQALADQCKFKHDDNDARRSFEFRSVGQNIAMSQNMMKNAKPNFKSMIGNWYDEVASMDASYVDAFPPEKLFDIGHYTQVVWAKTEKVGCGLSYYKSGMWYTTLFICNYGPAGNMRHGQIYEVGPACSKCSNGCSEDYSGLCA